MNKIPQYINNKVKRSYWWNSPLAKKIIPRSEFAKNVSILSGGSAIAQGLNILTIPLFSRLYSPTHFGVMALFITISTVMGTISSGRYELTILLPKKEKSAINITFLCIIIVALVGLLMLLLLIPFKNTIATLLGEPLIGNFLLLLPLDIFLYGTYNSLSYWLNRKKLYKAMSTETIIHVLTVILFRVLFSFILPDERGLIFSYLAGRIASFTVLLAVSFKSIDLSLINLKSIKKMAIKYKRFPIFSVPSTLTNSLSRNLTSIIMPNLFSSQSLGYYSMSQSILGLPSSVIATSISKVFFQEASEEKNERGNAKESFTKTLKRLTLLSVPLFLVLFLFIRPITTIVLGDQWRETGIYAQILIPLYAITFVSSSLSTIMAVFEKVTQGWIYNILLLSATMLSIGFTYFFSLSIIEFLFIHSILLGITYFSVLFYYKKVAFNKP